MITEQFGGLIAMACPFDKSPGNSDTLAESFGMLSHMQNLTRNR
jgi:hypothetical protein